MSKELNDLCIRQSEVDKQLAAFRRWNAPMQWFNYEQRYFIVMSLREETENNRRRMKEILDDDLSKQALKAELL